jgi:signal transduction histidine kinase
LRVRACHGKLEQGKLVLEQKPLNYELLCCSAFKMLMHTKRRGRDLVAVGGAVRWRQLLVNVISNATKFTKVTKFTKFQVPRYPSTTI